MSNDVPRLIPGGLSVDDRGTLTFCNDLQFEGIKRFYFVSNHQAGTVRAWHGHKRETKYVMAVIGAALVCAVEMPEAYSSMEPSGVIHRFPLSVSNPVVLYIPPGYANGWMSLTADCRLLFLSTATLDESRVDDVRFPARYWDPWETQER